MEKFKACEILLIVNFHKLFNLEVGFVPASFSILYVYNYHLFPFQDKGKVALSFRSIFHNHKHGLFHLQKLQSLDTLSHSLF